MEPLNRYAEDGAGCQEELGSPTDAGEQEQEQSLLGVSQHRTMVSRLVAIGLLLVGLIACYVLVFRSDSSSSSSPRLRADLRSTEEKEGLLKVIAKQLAKQQKANHYASEELESLGKGFCQDHHGEHFDGLDSANGTLWTDVADVAADGSSVACENQCLDDDKCTGYATYGTSKCGLVKGGYPSYADGKGEGHCFWRHQFLKNSKGAYTEESKPVPKIIWGYWQNLPPKGSDVPPTSLPPLIEICVASWRKLNPEWDVRVLNETTKAKYLDKSDLPGDYDKQAIQHKSDAVRIALLEKYGGVWVDASVFLLRPMEQILDKNPNVHNFMNLKTYWKRSTLFERRLNWTHYVENWFMAAPPHDPLISETRDCVMKLQPKLETWRPLAMTGMFSPILLEMMFGLTINTYLSMHACFLKTIMEDSALYHWYNGPNVNHIYAGEAGLRLSGLTGWDHKGAKEVKKRLFETVDEDLFEGLNKPEVKMIKIGGKLRKVVWGLSKTQLWCEESTFHMFVEGMELDTEAVCGDQAAVVNS